MRLKFPSFSSPTVPGTGRAARVERATFSADCTGNPRPDVCYEWADLKAFLTSPPRRFLPLPPASSPRHPSHNGTFPLPAEI
ncbi:Hypothetical protein NTJ_14560 [Nesidiocoris tenuis]|uniref:Uncharacterized protein n=1 Tax=Nesidiocoris tenuis TaxID=355587 RepID=A0ABN7BBJ6_9HEMI|nr:Hypothetical protein NTJ_14560 [Nesidiocoris tenuis]